MMKKFIQSVVTYAIVVMLVCSAYLTSGEQFADNEYVYNIAIFGTHPGVDKED